MAEKHESELSGPERHEQIAWLHHVLDATGWSKARLAVEAKIHPSTIVAFLLDKSNTAKLSDTTTEKIARAAGIAAPGKPRDDRANSDCVPVAAIEDNGFAEDIASMFPDVADHTLYRMTTQVLRAAGYLRDDYLFVDPHGVPKTGDIVVARQSVDTDESLLLARRFAKPFLCTAEFDQTTASVIPCDDAIEILGTVSLMYWQAVKRTAHR